VADIAPADPDVAGLASRRRIGGTPSGVGLGAGLDARGAGEGRPIVIDVPLSAIFLIFSWTLVAAVVFFLAFRTLPRV
jgi:hypothetical protein